jgi:hypothetical protein
MHESIAFLTSWLFLSCLGNLKAPSIENVLTWISSAWDSLSPEIIKKSFKVCGISTTTDGSEDHLINFFKDRPDGLKDLKQARVSSIAPVPLEEVPDEEEAYLNDLMIEEGSSDGEEREGRRGEGEVEEGVVEEEEVEEGHMEEREVWGPSELWALSEAQAPSEPRAPSEETQEAVSERGESSGKKSLHL